MPVKGVIIMFIDAGWLWVGFTVFVLGMLALDLGVFHRHAHEVRFKEALIWSGVWAGLALLFAGGVFIYGGSQKGLEFLTGYLIEWSLSVDNIFVFLVIFAYFAVPARYQHRVLFWGILSALVLRAVMIVMGAALIERFHWVIYLFGAVLVLSGIRMALQKETDVDPQTNPLVRLFERFMPVTPGYHNGRFFIIQGARRYATPLFIALLMVESADVMFALDSIPAIFAITTDPFIVYTSNIFAIMGLRSMYFALSGLVQRFHYLRAGLSVILVFVGVKMLLSDIYKIPTLLSLGVVLAVLAISVLASIVRPPHIELPSPGAQVEAGADRQDLTPVK
jgi:tellurite resistance protein TerC